MELTDSICGPLAMERSEGSQPRQQEMTTFTHPCRPMAEILLLSWQTSNSAGDLFLLSLENGSLRQLTSDRRGIRGLAWNPDGNSILFSSNRSGIYSLWTISTGGSLGYSITTNSNEATDPSIANDGLIAFTATAQNSNIWRLDLRDPNHLDRSRLISSSRRNDSAQYSPDGQKIVFASDRTGNWELWVSNQDGELPSTADFLPGANARHTSLVSRWQVDSL